MRPDPKMEAGRWLRQAENDLAAGEALLDRGFCAQACFQAQQAAEKALKALRYQKEGLPPRGHVLSATSTSGQLRIVIEHVPSFARFQEDAGTLDLYYTPTRYPDVLPGTNAPYEVFSETQAAEAMQKSGNIVAAVKGEIHAAS